MSFDAIKSHVKTEFDAVNQLIINHLNAEIGLIDSLCHHIIDSGGKRLRPLVVLLSAKACGYNGEKQVPLATAIEYFHTATLLHDDVVDDSTLRRGKETAHEIYGSKSSILVGDYLFTLAMQLMIEVGRMDILRLMSHTSHQLTCGEIQQLSNRHKDNINREQYFEVIRNKTAILFAASAKIGALLANLCTEQADAMYAYGLHLGNAFQLIDDALDYTANSETIGKNIGDDLADGKPTLPLIYILETGSESQKTLVKASIQEGKIDNLPAIIDAIKSTKAIEHTQEVAKQEVDKARQALKQLPDSQSRQHLDTLAHLSLDRTS